MPRDEDTIAGSVRVFCEGHRLLEGGGVSQLTERLLERGEARHGALVEVERFRRILRGNVRQLDAMGRLTEGEGRLQLSIQQTGDLGLSLAARRQAIHRAVSDDIAAQTDEMARGRGAGIAAAKQWAEQACGVVENMVEEAVLDTVRFDSAVNKLQHKAEYYRRDYIPRIGRRRQILFPLRPSAVEEEASRYIGVLEDIEISKMRRAAHLAAIETLRDVAA